MPRYDYRCARCRAVFECTHPMSAPAPSCPGCGAAAERTILSAPAMHGMASRGREQAMRSLPQCGKGCRCCP